MRCLDLGCRAGPMEVGGRVRDRKAHHVDPLSVKKGFERLPSTIGLHRAATWVGKDVLTAATSWISRILGDLLPTLVLDAEEIIVSGTLIRHYLRFLCCLLTVLLAHSMSMSSGSSGHQSPCTLPYLPGKYKHGEQHETGFDQLVQERWRRRCSCTLPY